MVLGERKIEGVVETKELKEVRLGTRERGKIKRSGIAMMKNIQGDARESLKDKGGRRTTSFAFRVTRIKPCNLRVRFLKGRTNRMFQKRKNP